MINRYDARIMNSSIHKYMKDWIFIDSTINSINPYLKEYEEVPAEWERMINKILPVLFPNKTLSRTSDLVYSDDYSFALFRSKYLKVFEEDLLKVFKSAFKLKRCTPGYYIVQSFKG